MEREKRWWDGHAVVGKLGKGVGSILFAIGYVGAKRGVSSRLVEVVRSSCFRSSALFISTPHTLSFLAQIVKSLRDGCEIA